MWTIMVADDEPKIRRGLCRFVEQSGLPLQICAQASDGAQALHLLREQRPDILLLDINMPHLSGLEVLAEAKKLDIRGKYILLTGFDEFSFAQQSVSLRAFAYLLKPIDEPELKKQLDMAIAELEAEQRQAQHSKQALVQLAHNENLLKSAFEQNWLSGQLTEDEWREGALFWGIEWPKTPQLTLLRPDFKMSNNLYRQEQSLMLFGATNIAQELLAPLLVCFCAQDEKGYSAIVTATPPPEALLEEISTTIRRCLTLQCQMDTLPLDAPAQLPDTVAQLRHRLEESERANPLISEIKAFIDAHYRNPELSLVNLANALNVSQPYLSRLMKSALSTTFVDYLTAKRMSEAIRLMADPEKKLSWISTQVGYSNQHYFSNVFKKHTGKSPSSYRETLDGRVPFDADTL